MEEVIKVCSLFPRMVVLEDNVKIFAAISLKELEAILHQFKKYESPDPNGWTIEFFMGFFNILGEDLLRVVEEIRISGRLLSGIKSTFLTLIPKVEKPKEFGDFLPISLCKKPYKINAKIIAERFKPFLAQFKFPGSSLCSD